MDNPIYSQFFFPSFSPIVREWLTGTLWFHLEWPWRPPIITWLELEHYFSQYLRLGVITLWYKRAFPIPPPYLEKPEVPFGFLQVFPWRIPMIEPNLATPKAACDLWSLGVVTYARISMEVCGGRCLCPLRYEVWKKISKWYGYNMRQMNVCMNLCVCIYICIYIYTHTHVYTCIYMYANVYIHLE